MPGTYSQILLHIVFSTKLRQSLIKESIRDRLYAYIGGIVRAEDGIALAIGGMPDHIHLLIRWRTDSSVADLMRALKSQSSHWVHQTFSEFSEFAWQDGYAVFSVSKSGEVEVKRYIENQIEHHRGWDFKEELLALLRAHAIPFEERFVFE